MAPGVRDLELTSLAGGLKIAGDDSDDLEDVRLLDSYDNIDDGMRRIQVRVSGMTCAACSNSVESALKAVDGVLSASVSLLQNKADIVFNPALLKDEDIKNAIEDAGFEADILPESGTLGKIPHGTLVGQFTIGGMTCAACVNSVEGILRNLPGVKRAVVALATSLGEVEYDSSVISKDDIVNAIEDSGFEASFVQSSEQDKIVLGVVGVYSLIDAQVLEGMLSSVKGVKQFHFDQISGELDVLFDPEVLSSRSLVDGIQEGSNGKFKLHVRSPYTRMASKDVEEASTMFRLFISSLLLSLCPNQLLHSRRPPPPDPDTADDPESEAPPPSAAARAVTFLCTFSARVGASERVSYIPATVSRQRPPKEAVLPLFGPNPLPAMCFSSPLSLRS
ncbi:Heavy-metal-associated, conserved site [Sesbania bispinosa]|nr:Heavy-metal-associated, conserved site [Sesbania bispinosa]